MTGGRWYLCVLCVGGNVEKFTALRPKLILDTLTHIPTLFVLSH